MTRKGFTLLEVLIAGSVLFLVAAGVVGLSNSIIQGTRQTIDEMVMNRWAQEGLEQVKAFRDGRILRQTQDSWLPQAINPRLAGSSPEFGFFRLENGNPGERRILSGAVPASDLIGRGAERLEQGPVIAYRVICFESLAASSRPDNARDENLYCNVLANGQEAPIDGPRTRLGHLRDCDERDKYCQNTKESLNRDNPRQVDSPILIPSGNAIKVRSIVIWQDREITRSTEIATILTNWQWSGNVR